MGHTPWNYAYSPFNTLETTKGLNGGGGGIEVKILKNKIACFLDVFTFEKISWKHDGGLCRIIAACKSIFSCISDAGGNETYFPFPS